MEPGRIELEKATSSYLVSVHDSIDKHSEALDNHAVMLRDAIALIYQLEAELRHVKDQVVALNSQVALLLTNCPQTTANWDSWGHAAATVPLTEPQPDGWGMYHSAVAASAKAASAAFAQAVPPVNVIAAQTPSEMVMFVPPGPPPGLPPGKDQKLPSDCQWPPEKMELWGIAAVPKETLKQFMYEGQEMNNAQADPLYIWRSGAVWCQWCCKNYSHTHHTSEGHKKTRNYFFDLFWRGGGLEYTRAHLDEAETPDAVFYANWPARAWPENK